MKYPVTIQTRTTQIVKRNFSYLVLTGFLKIIGVKIQLPITFCTAWSRIKISKSRNSTPTHEVFTFNILLHITT